MDSLFIVWIVASSSGRSERNISRPFLGELCKFSGLHNCINAYNWGIRGLYAELKLHKMGYYTGILPLYALLFGVVVIVIL
jgi:hypothetical protein